MYRFDSGDHLDYSTDEMGNVKLLKFRKMTDEGSLINSQSDTGFHRKMKEQCIRWKKKNLQRFIVQWDFKADKRDEVDLLSGDVVLVVKIYQDGWCRGIRCRDYKVGCFPLNYLVKEENIPGKRQSILLLERAYPVEQRPTSKEVKTGLLIDFDDNKNFNHKSYDDWNFGRGSDGSSWLGDDQDDIDDSNESDDEPPDLPEKYSKIRERQEKESKARTRAAEEILSSEVSYLNGLRLLSENYINPMREQKIVSKSDVCRIFSNVESLASISDELINKLQDRLSNWEVQSTLLGDVLQEMFSYLKMFEPYFNSRQKANEVIAKLEKNSEKYKSFITKVNCSHTLDSLLLMPVQRIPRYELLLKELVKRTKEDHPDYWSLKEALNKAQKAAADLNEHIRKIENETKVVQVMKKFPNDELNLIRPVSQTTVGRGTDTQRTRKYEKEQIATLSKSLKRISLPLSQSLEDTPRLSRSASTSPMTIRRELSPGRRSSQTVLVRQGTSVDDGDSDSSDESQSLGETFIYTSVYIGEGPVERVTRKASGTSEGGMVHETVERYLFLFNDVLLLASSSGKKNYKLKANLPLAKAWVTSTNVYYTNPPETMFLLGTPTQIYKFLAPSTKARKTWERDLDKCIEKEKMLFFQSFERLPVPDEVYLAATMETKIDYQRASDGVELNLRQGEEVLVIGFMDGDQWHPGLYPHSVFEQGKEWWPGIQKGIFGWFPAQCVTGSETTTLHATEEELHPIPVAIALSRIKRTMLKWTKNEELPILDVKVVKVYRPDTSFKTCKVEPDFLISDLLRQYTKHKSFRGAEIDINILELAEESLDGSVHTVLKHDQLLSDILAMWGKYQEKMRLVIREFGEAQSGVVSQLLGSV